MVRLAGLEPAAYGLEVRCSIQLSYRRMEFDRSIAYVAEIVHINCPSDDNPRGLQMPDWNKI
jgi:hypothetical protein